MAKKNVVRVDLVSTESPSRRAVVKSSKRKDLKLRKRMYDPNVRKHVWFEEKKQARAS
ncbi:MAG: hypothetical protein LEGION0398_MBIBDBAK_00716 [Legionellaceae bacterium]